MIVDSPNPVSGLWESRLISRSGAYLSRHKLKEKPDLQPFYQAPILVERWLELSKKQLKQLDYNNQL